MKAIVTNQRRRWIVFLLVTVAIALYGMAYFLPIWGFYLYAPQYPHGLSLAIYIDRVAGDTMEIDILNHYIGMAKLGAAAEFERAIAVYVLIGIALCSLLVASFPRKRGAVFSALPAIVFPFVFALIMFVWMYKFGHELDPAAPVRMSPFTPKLLGKGIIGNFRTYGMPGPGFYMFLGAVPLMATAAKLRWNEFSLDYPRYRKARGLSFGMEKLWGRIKQGGKWKEEAGVESGVVSKSETAPRYNEA
jgi:hypothetical protein